MRYHFTFTKVVKILEKKNVGPYMEKLEPSHTARELYKGAVTLKNSLVGSQKIKYRDAI